MRLTDYTLGKKPIAEATFLDLAEALREAGADSLNVTLERDGQQAVMCVATGEKCRRVLEALRDEEDNRATVNMEEE